MIDWFEIESCLQELSTPGGRPPIYRIQSSLSDVAHDPAVADDSLDVLSCCSHSIQTRQVSFDIVSGNVLWAHFE